MVRHEVARRPRPIASPFLLFLLLITVGCASKTTQIRTASPSHPPARSSNHDLTEIFSIARSEGLVDPVDLAVDPAGRLLVLDAAGPDLVLFDVDGRPIDRHPVSGSEAVSFFRPERIRVSGLAILLLDPAQRVILRYDLRGKYQGVALDLNAFADEIGFFEPADFAVDGAGQLFLSDREGHRILVFSPTSRFLLEFGEFGEGLGQLRVPDRLMVDEEGYLYVVERGNRRVHRFDGFGAPLGTVTLRGAAAGGLPVSMSEYRGRIVVVADEEGRVALYPRTVLTRERAPSALLSHHVTGAREVAVHPDGRIFILAMEPGRIVALDVGVE